MTMTRPASLLALLALPVGALATRATVLLAREQTRALGKETALRAPPSARSILAGTRADYRRRPRP